MSLSGQQVGSYWIGQRLGAGGMAEVYEGEHVDPGLARKVAIKVLRAEHCNNPELVERFVNEAKALGRINHPGVVHIYDVAYLPDRRVCLIMAYLQGKTLDAWRRERGQLSVQEALPLMIQLADTMAAAHDQSIIHRDIKPENIFVIPDPVMGMRTKVLDFGIAKLQGNAGSVKTRTQTTLGTAAYMPPEQFRSSKDVDHRSDIYSLGCVFFELLAGRPPFVARTLVEHMRMHAFEEPPPLTSVVPSAPVEIEQIISAMLVKDPNGRYASMRQLQQDLQTVHGGGRPTGPQAVVQRPPQQIQQPPSQPYQQSGYGYQHGHPPQTGHGHGPGPSHGQYGHPHGGHGQTAHVGPPGGHYRGQRSGGSAGGSAGGSERVGLIAAIVLVVVVIVLVVVFAL